MKNNIHKIIFILVAIIFAGCSINKNIVFDNENDLYIFLLNKVKQNKIKIIQKDIPNYFEGFTMSDSKDSILLKQVHLDEKYKIDLFTYKYVPSDYSRFHHEYVQVNGYKIFIDSLLKENNNTLIEKDPYIAFTSIGSFYDKEYNYIVLEGENRLFYKNRIIKSYLLFQFSNGILYNSWLFYNGGSSNLVFNDFDGDGNLDYLKWKPRNETINIFHLKERHFIRDSLHYLIIKPTNSQKKETNLIWYLKLNKPKSIWYKDL